MLVYITTGRSCQRMKCCMTSVTLQTMRSVTFCRWLPGVCTFIYSFIFSSICPSVHFTMHSFNFSSFVYCVVFQRAFSVHSVSCLFVYLWIYSTTWLICFFIFSLVWLLTCLLAPTVFHLLALFIHLLNYLLYLLIFTSAKEVMFLPDFVCLSVCLSVCVSAR